MKAIIVKKHGSPDGLQLQEIEKPSPKDNEILVKVHGATVTAGDSITRKLPRFANELIGLLLGFKRKGTPGIEFAGQVESVGKNVSKFKQGDSVFGTTTGLSVGANAEYICLPEEWKMGVMAIKPSNMSYEEAAAVPVGGMTALQILERGNIQSGQKVLIYGASGSVGTYAVQLAKHHYGAEVTGICSSKNVAMVKSLGADDVIDYTQEDLAEHGETYDVIFDAVGKISKSKVKHLLKDNAVYLSVKSSTSEETGNLEFLRELIESGKIKAIIDKRYSLEQVPEAHRYVDTGRKAGNVVITMA